MDGSEGVAADVAAAVDPDEDRERPLALGRPDIEVEAVFAVDEGHRQSRWLHATASRTPAKRVASRSPVQGLLGTVGRKRSGPTGGSAKGTPRKMLTLSTD